MPLIEGTIDNPAESEIIDLWQYGIGQGVYKLALLIGKTDAAHERPQYIYEFQNIPGTPTGQVQHIDDIEIPWKFPEGITLNVLSKIFIRRLSPTCPLSWLIDLETGPPPAPAPGEPCGSA